MSLLQSTSDFVYYIFWETKNFIDFFFLFPNECKIYLNNFFKSSVFMFLVLLKNQRIQKKLI